MQPREWDRHMLGVSTWHGPHQRCDEQESWAPWRHSVPTGFMKIGSWVKERDPVYILARFPKWMNLSFPSTFQLLVLLVGARDMQESCKSLQEHQVAAMPWKL